MIFPYIIKRSYHLQTGNTNNWYVYSNMITAHWKSLRHLPPTQEQPHDRAKNNSLEYPEITGFAWKHSRLPVLRKWQHKYDKLGLFNTKDLTVEI